MEDTKLYGIFERITKEMKESYPARIAAIRARSKKRYMNDGDFALGIVLGEFQKRELWTTFNAALKEVERLYELEDSKGGKK